MLKSITGSRPRSRHFFASPSALPGGSSLASTGTSLPSSRWVVPQATYWNPAALIPASARASGKRLYGRVMHAIWKAVGFFGSAAAASGGRKPPVAVATAVARTNSRRVMASAPPAPAGSGGGRRPGRPPSPQPPRGPGGPGGDGEPGGRLGDGDERGHVERLVVEPVEPVRDRRRDDVVVRLV